MNANISRRDLLRYAALGSATLAVAACQPQVVEITTVVEKEVTVVVPEAAPTKVAGPPVPISCMHLEGELTDDEVDLFNDKYPHIKLSRIDLDDVRYYAMLASGNPPDVKRQEGTALPYLLVRRIPLNLQPYFDVSEIIKEEDLASTNNYWKAASPFEHGTGDRYGMIKDWTPGLTLWCNVDLFAKAGLDAPSDEVPVDYDQVLMWAEALTEKEGDRTLAWGFAHHPGWMHHYWECWLHGLGKAFWSEDKQKFLLLDQEESIEALKWDYDLAKAGLTQSPLDPTARGWIGPDFMAGQVAITQFGLWFAAMIQGRMGLDGMEYEQDPMFVPGPIWKGGKEVDVDFASMGALVSRETKHPDEAWKVNEWYHAEDPAENRAKQGWGVPALKSWYDLMPTDTSIFRQAQKVAFGQEAKGATEEILTFSPFVKGDAVGSAFHTHFERALKDEITLQEFMDNIQGDVDQQIKQGMAALGL